MMCTLIFKRIFRFMGFINGKILILHIVSMIPEEQNYVFVPKNNLGTILEKGATLFKSLLLV